MALSRGAFAAMGRPTAAEKPRPVQEDGFRRRGLLSFLLLSTVAAAPNLGDSKTALLQEYIKKSKENKGKNDKERLDDYYKRNYKDYFEFVEGSNQDKDEGQLSESEKAIREWLKKNR